MALPTPEEMFAAAERDLNKAYRALGDASDCLRSDWKPGASLTTDQAKRRQRMQAGINRAKSAINQAKRASSSSDGES